jgi:hypothetical protein
VHWTSTVALHWVQCLSSVILSEFSSEDFLVTVTYQLFIQVQLWNEPFEEELHMLSATISLQSIVGMYNAKLYIEQQL